MKNRIMTYTILTLVLLTTIACAPASRNITSNPDDLQFDDLQYQAPNIEIITLDNGMKLYLLEDHELPLINVRVQMRVGSLYEPADKVGLAAICGETMRTGGTAKYTPEELDEKLEFLAANLGCSIGQEMGNASLNVLTKDLDAGLEMLAQILRFPAFDQSRLTISQQNHLEAIRRRDDDPSGIAHREFTRLVYGRDNPWGRIEQPQTISAINRDDVVAFHARYIQPAEITLGISGDFNKKELTTLIEKYFGDWQGQAVKYPEVAAIDTNIPVGVHLLERDVPQSVIVIGHLGHRRLDPAQMPLVLFNGAFGTGGFTSRLLKEVRTNRGLAYGAWGYISKGTDLGLFRMATSTKASTTVETIEVLISEMRRALSEPITQAEIDQARASEVNRFVFNFESPAKIISQRMDLDFYGYPEDWMTRYVETLQQITVEQVNQAAQKFLHPDNLVLTIIGKQETFDKPLSSLNLGPVIPITLDPVALDTSKQEEK